MLFLSSPGIDKSHLVCAIGVCALKAGKNVYCCTLAELSDSLSLARRTAQFASKLRYFTRTTLLGYLKAGMTSLMKRSSDAFLRSKLIELSIQDEYSS